MERQRRQVRIFFIKTPGNRKKLTTIYTEKEKVFVDALFLSYSPIPNTELFETQLSFDDLGYIYRTHDQETSVQGIFAFGDAAAWPVQSFLKHFREEFEYHIEHKRCMVGGSGPETNTEAAA